jgi:hypothetical protein
MAFEVFRRHQRKLLAVFAILAMFGFVVSDSLPRLLSSNAPGRDQPVVKLHGRTIYQSDLNEMAMERSYANQFCSRFLGPKPFGDLKTRDLVDALILQHEADRLGLPTGPQEGKDFLRRVTEGRMNGEIFRLFMGDLNNRVSEDQILSAIANQVRLNYVRGEVYTPQRMLFAPDQLLGSAMVTPYDIYRAYRDENEKVSAKVVEVPVSKFLPQVPEPSAQELQAYYDKYKDVLPDPSRPTPGFKVPRQVQVETLSIDGNALARAIKDRLTEAELQTAYENRKSEFEVRPGRGDLPSDLFAGHPEWTPPIIQPFSDVRSVLASSLAEEKAQTQIEEQFDRLKHDVLDKFFDEYQDSLDAREEAKKDGARALPALPQPGHLKELAKRENLTYDLSPLVSREDAETYGTISGAQVGLSRVGDGKKFTDEFFDTKAALYESVMLSDFVGRRYLTRKVQDVPPRVPSLDEVRSQVALAWKTEKAQPLAEKAAEQLAEQLKKQGNPPKDATFQGYPVVTIPSIARKYTPLNLSANQFRMSDPEDTPISEVPFPGDAFRSAYFSLQPGSVAVAPNQPRTSYYAMMLERREPATFAALYAPAGDSFRYSSFAREQASRQLVDNWMNWLRRQAGVDPNWVPADEAKEKEAATSRS